MHHSSTRLHSKGFVFLLELCVFRLAFLQCRISFLQCHVSFLQCRISFLKECLELSDSALLTREQSRRSKSASTTRRSTGVS